MTSLQTTAATPSHDYRAALKNAISWLGDRYLLAEPATRRPSEHPGISVVELRLPRSAEPGRNPSR